MILVPVFFLPYCWLEAMDRTNPKHIMYQFLTCLLSAAIVLPLTNNLLAALCALVLPYWCIEATDQSSRWHIEFQFLSCPLFAAFVYLLLASLSR